MELRLKFSTLIWSIMNRLLIKQEILLSQEDTLLTIDFLRQMALT